VATVKQGTRTRAPQWWDHLRKKWKRVFWKRERKSIRQEVKRELP
jgi:hypothetical protein